MGYRNYSVANGFVVDKLGNGDFTTIGAALTAAVSGDTIFIRSGTYTENPTFKAGVNITAFTCDAFTPNVIINGNCTYTGSGTVSISGIQFEASSGDLIFISGSNPSVINLNSCYLNVNTNTGIGITSSNSSAGVNVNYCGGNLGNSAGVLYGSTSPGFLGINYCIFTNTGGATQQSFNSAGRVIIFQSTFQNKIVCETTGGIFVYGSVIDTSSVNITPLTCSGSGTQVVKFTSLNGGSNPGLQIGISATLSALYIEVFSSNTDAILGGMSSVLDYSYITFTGSSSTVSVGTANAFTTLPP